ncbi:Unknown protein sequence [Pseudomonas coronafaciens pv. oryzae]|nr:Unknown protein sequence [Pseudomonas coronafaciens pv. oryzae]
MIDQHLPPPVDSAERLNSLGVWHLGLAILRHKIATGVLELR